KGYPLALEIAGAVIRTRGLSFGMLLRELRLEAAKAYLVSSKQTITEIADKTGFSSSTLFCRVFRKAVGQTPMAYRAAAAKRIQFQNTTLEPDEHIF
ncbi:MAG TPA: helix-turn-helix transcriptional regulator, partial [Lacunisphaera sp.]|nr:helix-turn-helix transcriptional regulator [Lacunisphaera sp.]